MDYQDTLGITTLATIGLWITIVISFVFNGITVEIGRGLIVSIPLTIFVTREWIRLNNE